MVYKVTDKQLHYVPTAFSKKATRKLLLFQTKTKLYVNYICAAFQAPIFFINFIN